MANKFKEIVAEYFARGWYSFCDIVYRFGFRLKTRFIEIYRTGTRLLHAHGLQIVMEQTLCLFHSITCVDKYFNKIQSMEKNKCEISLFRVKR